MFTFTPDSEMPHRSAASAMLCPSSFTASIEYRTFAGSRCMRSRFANREHPSPSGLFQAVRPRKQLQRNKHFRVLAVTGLRGREATVRLLPTQQPRPQCRASQVQSTKGAVSSPSATHYNQTRTHLSVNKDAPSPHTVHAVGRIVQTPFLDGLHHLYVRV